MMMALIRRALQDLVRSARPDDFLFVHYSGRGTRLPAETGEHDDTGFDECIIPSDMNLITAHLHSLGSTPYISEILGPI
ncbi:unnamed protein product [Amaranthus hypochondriacus]